MKSLSIITLSLLLFSCGDAENATDELQEDDAQTEVQEEDPTEEVVVDQYEQDWEKFKQAVLDQDLQGVGAFASSDKIDSEMLLMVMGEQVYLDALKNTSFSDLTANETEQGPNLEFTASETGVDEEGNEVGSAVSIYFTKGENGLLLDYYIVAG